MSPNIQFYQEGCPHRLFKCENGMCLREEMVFKGRNCKVQEKKILATKVLGNIL